MKRHLYLAAWIYKATDCQVFRQPVVLPNSYSRHFSEQMEFNVGRKWLQNNERYWTR